MTNRIVISKAPRGKLLRCTQEQLGHLYTVLEPITVYKKVSDGPNNVAVIELILLPGAVVRLGAYHNSRKCRADHVFVPAYENKNKLRSMHNEDFVYPKEQVLFPLHFCTGDAECAGGIHFFFQRKDAENYIY